RPFSRATRISRGLQPRCTCGGPRVRPSVIAHWSRSMSALAIVFLPIDAAAVAIVGALDAAGLAQGVRARFHVVHMRFAALQVAHFAIGERTVGDAVVDALLLVDVALHVGLRKVGFQRIGIAGLRIMLLVVDRGAFVVLLALDLRLFRSRQRPVGEIALFGAIDARFALFKLAGFARGELTRLQSLLDALLLIHVALGFRTRALRLRHSRETQAQRDRTGEQKTTRMKALHDVLPFWSAANAASCGENVFAPGGLTRLRGRFRPATALAQTGCTFTGRRICAASG